MEHLQLSDYSCRAAINDDEIKNIQLAPCAGFTQLEKKLLQHLDDMLLKNNILLQQIKQGHLFVGGLTIFAWSRVRFKISRGFIF